MAPLTILRRIYQSTYHALVTEFREEELIANTLPLSRFCDSWCRHGYASDVRLALAQTLPQEPTGVCPDCGNTLPNQGSTRPQGNHH